MAKTSEHKFFTPMLLSLAAVASLVTGCAKLPDDGANAKPSHYENLNRVRYSEIFVVGGNGVTGNMLINVYNTIGAQGFDAKTNKDSAPQTWVEGVKADEIEKQFGALGAAINGPKLLMLDWMDLPSGMERDFNGKKIPWVALLHLTKEQVKKLGKFRYEPITIERKSKFGINKGTLAILIDDADGNTWVMKGFELGMNPAYTFEEFVANAPSRFKELPKGWKVRTKVLDQDLVLVPETGIATIMPDEFFNVYDKTGPGYSNYKP